MFASKVSYWNLIWKRRLINVFDEKMSLQVSPGFAWQLSLDNLISFDKPFHARNPHFQWVCWYCVFFVDNDPMLEGACLLLSGPGGRIVCHSQLPYSTHWGRVTHTCFGKLTIIDSNNGLSPVRRQAIIWTNAGILLIEPLGTNFSEILIGIQIFSFKKMRLKMSSAKWRPFCLGLNVLTMAAPQWKQLYYYHDNCVSVRRPIIGTVRPKLVPGPLLIENNDKQSEPVTALGHFKSMWCYTYISLSGSCDSLYWLVDYAIMAYVVGSKNSYTC